MRKRTNGSIVPASEGVLGRPPAQADAGERPAQVPRPPLRHRIPQRIRDRTSALFGAPTIEASLQNLKRLGFRPRSAIDVGAFIGTFTRQFKRIFPDAAVLMVEPQLLEHSHREWVLRNCSNVESVRVLAGAENRERVPLRLGGTGSSILPTRGASMPPTTQVPMRRLDEVVAGGRFGAPDFLKIDIQGYELEAFKGAPNVLAACEVVVAEVSLIDVYEGGALFPEVDEHLRRAGFRLYDVAGLMRRASDQALFQMDLVYVRNSSPLVASQVP